MPNPLPADDSHLSIEDAVGLLDAGEDGGGDLAGNETENSAGDDSTPADAESPDDEVAVPSGDEESDADPDPEADPLPSIEAPRSWNAEAKAKFAALPRDVQEVIAARDGDREKALSVAQQEAAESRKRVDTEIASIGQYKAALDKLLPDAISTFENRWKDVDWDKVITQFGAEEALKLQNQFQREQGQLQQLKVAQQQAHDVERRKFVQAEFGKLKDVAPDLVDEKEGRTRREAVGKFLVESGVPTEQLNGISAIEMSIAYDAMRYRQARANLAKPKKPAIAPVKTVVKPTGAKPAVAPQKQAVATLQARAFKTGRIDDMVALLDAESD